MSVYDTSRAILFVGGTVPTGGVSPGDFAAEAAARVAADAAEAMARTAAIAAEAEVRAALGRAALVNLAAVSASGTVSGTVWSVSWSTLRGRLGGVGIDIADVAGLAVQANEAAVITMISDVPSGYVYPVTVEANTSGLRLAIEAGIKIPLLFNRAGALSGLLADQIRASGIALAASAARTIADEALAGSEAAAALSATAMLAATEGGQAIRLLRLSPDDPAMVLMDSAGNVAMAFDDDGRQVYPDPQVIEDSDLPLYLPLLDEDSIRGVGADDVLLAPATGLSVLSLTPARGHVLAVVDRPGRTSRSQIAAANGYLIPAASDELNVFIGFGQSLIVGRSGQTQLVSAPLWPSDALMFDTTLGPDIRMGCEPNISPSVLDPADLIGFTAARAMLSPANPNSFGQTPMESMLTALAAEARRAGVRFRCLGILCALGGTNYAGLKKGSQPYANMLVALDRAIELAAQQGMKVVVRAIAPLKHGESDQSNTAYVANLIELQADIEADVQSKTGQLAAVPIIMAPPSSFYAQGEPTLAMTDLHLASPKFHLASPDYAFLSDYDPADLLHFLGEGSFRIGEKVAHAVMDAIWRAEAKSRVTIVDSLTRAENVVTVRVRVPYAPLTLDTAALPEIDQYGMRYFVGDTEYAISSQSITNSGSSGLGTIQLVLGSTPPGSDGRLDVAWPGHAPSDRQVGTIPRTNYRDSDPRISGLGGYARNWLHHGKFPHL